MQKKLVLIWLVLMSTLSMAVSALELDSAELRRALQSTDLEFINYQGPYDVINTIEQIRAIGRALSREMAENPDALGANYFGKYLIIRVLDTNAPDLLSADLYVVESTAEVDSIMNIRRMLSGYLMDTFQYNREDADLLAKLITLYNAIYRGDMENVRKHYVSAVADQVTEDNVGLARVYSQWAGRTRMLIPLRSTLEGGSAALVNVNALTTSQVMNTLIGSEADPADIVQQVVDHQDQVNQEEQQSVTDLVDMITERDQALTDEQRALEEELAAIERGEGTRSAEEIRRDLEANKAQQEALSSEKARADAAQENLNQNEQATDLGREQAQSLIEGQQQPVSEAQPATGNETGTTPSQGKESSFGEEGTKPADGEIPTQATQRPTNAAKPVQPQQAAQSAPAAAQRPTSVKPIQQEPAVLTSSQQEQSEVVAQVGNLVYFTRILDGPKGVGQALLVDSTNRRILAQSADLNVMRGSSVLRGDKLIVLTLEKDGARLKALDAATLAEKSQALYLIHARTSMNASTDRIYLVVEKDNNWYLASFGAELTVGEVLSEDAVMPYTDMRFQDGDLYIEGANGEILKLDPATLKQK